MCGEREREGGRDGEKEGKRREKIMTKEKIICV